MKRFVVLMLCLCLCMAVSAVYADEAAEGFKVTYDANECLASVPEDAAVYAAGDEVTVLFEPVEYKDYLIFFGWDMDGDGVADFGYDYKTFEMPESDVELKAVCIGASYYGAGRPAPQCGPDCAPGHLSFHRSYGHGIDFPKH